MELLKELFAEIKATEALTEKKKPKAVEDKARGKLLNDTLKSRKGGRHFSPKTDYKRSHEKADARKSMCEGTDTE